MKKEFLYLFLMIALFGCKKINLDAFAFPSVKLDEYQFENYDPGGLPSSLAIDPANRTLVTMESVDQDSGEKYTIYGVYIGDMTTMSTDTVILYLHGQSHHMDHYWNRAALLANVGDKHNYGVFMIDYRGYGMSQGESTEQSLYEDANAAISWLRNAGVDEHQFVYYGYSLGAIPAIDRASFLDGYKPDKLIIESPLASVEHLVHSSTVINVSPGFVTTLDFPNAEKIKSYNGALLWMHGKEDDYIAIENGELIYGNHNGAGKTAHRVDGAGHGNVPNEMGVQNYLDALLEFIQD